jgi:hypothetical protein
MEDTPVILGPVSAGFDKWSMSIVDGNVKIEHNRHPNYGTLLLCDASYQNFRDLSEMFARAAEREPAKKK